ncbi:MAG: LLM class flavin-dependent oxidoreductase [Candidatus Acidiferrales bacterium]
MKSLSETPLSVLDLAPIREGKSLADTFAASLALARYVESLGYKRFWLAEHHNLAGVASSATSVLIGFIASGTKKIRVGSGGIMLPNHAPLMVAEEFGTLETLYPGRIDLGLGRAPGTDQATMRALRKRLGPEDDFEELLQELQFFLAPAKPNQQLRAIPGANLDIPIWILGSSLYSAHLAAAHGLPYAFAGHFAPEEMLNALVIYRREFQPSEVLKNPYVMIATQALAADTDEQADFLSTTLYLRFLGLIRNQRTALLPPVKDTSNLWSPSEHQAIKNRLRYAAIGGPAKIAGSLQNLIDLTQADELIINSEPYDSAARLRSFEIIAGSRSAH